MTINELKCLISLLQRLNHEDQKASVQIEIEKNLNIAERELEYKINQKPRLSGGSNNCS